MKKIKNPIRGRLVPVPRPDFPILVPSPEAPADPPIDPRPSGALDVIVDIQPRVAGMEKGRIYNPWLDCAFDIRPLKVGDGFEWFADFRTTVEPVGTQRFIGTAKTRALAKGVLMDTITKHIQEVHDARQRAHDNGALGSAIGSATKLAVVQSVFATKTLGFALKNLVSAIVRALVSMFRRRAR